MILTLIALATFSRSQTAYFPLQTFTYCTVDGHALTMNAILPIGAKNAPAMVDIHGGWFLGGEPATGVPPALFKRHVAFFSIAYRLGDAGGFPQAVRDCRNAIRYIRKNAVTLNVDLNRIAVMGGSAGGHLSLMCAMVPEKFDDGGPTPELVGISASVCGAFSWIPPTDLVQFWNQGPDDVVTSADGTKTFRRWDEKVQNDSRPHLRALFHGATPETDEGRQLYTRMSPIGHVRNNVPPLLICDGERDPIVPGEEGNELYEMLKAAGADCTYWLSVGKGHEYPSGEGFDAVLDRYLDRIYSK